MTEASIEDKLRMLIETNKEELTSVQSIKKNQQGRYIVTLGKYDASGDVLRVYSYLEQAGLIDNSHKPRREINGVTTDASPNPVGPQN